METTHKLVLVTNKLIQGIKNNSSIHKNDGNTSAYELLRVVRRKLRSVFSHIRQENINVIHLTDITAEELNVLNDIAASIGINKVAVINDLPLDNELAAIRNNKSMFDNIFNR